MGNSNIKSDSNNASDNHVTRERQNDVSQVRKQIRQNTAGK